VTQHADFTPLQTLSTVPSEIRATLRHEGAEDIATVTLTVPPSSKGMALFQHVTIKRSAGGDPIVPILWSENDVTLWPGEMLTLTAHFAAPGEGTPLVEVSGWNVPTRSVPVSIESQAAAAQESNH
jgi:exo-1,4-beta-D-glucosaminidase